MTETTAVALVPEVSEKIGRATPEEAAYRVLMHQAKTIAESGLFGFKTPQQALAIMLVAQAEGRHPALAARDYDVIQGRPAKKAEAMLRDFLAAGGSVEWHELSDTKADATFSHPQGGKARIPWDHARAKQAGLDSKDMYRKYPRQMLRSRVVSEGVRTVFPAATSGMYVPEEVQDFGNERSEVRAGGEAKSNNPATSTPGTSSPAVAPKGFNVAGEPIIVGVPQKFKHSGIPLSQATELQILDSIYWSNDKGAEYDAWRAAAEAEVKARREAKKRRQDEPMDQVPEVLTKTTAEDLALDKRLAASGK